MTDTPRKKYAAPAHFCAACRARGKIWNGGDPECSFQHGRPFSPDGWNCATVDKIRDILRIEHGKPRPDGISLDWSAEGYQSIAMIRTDPDYIETSIHAYALYVTWYKDRGRTGGMWLMGDEENPVPVPPTEAEVLAIAEYYSPEKIAARAAWLAERNGNY